MATTSYSFDPVTEIILLPHAVIIGDSINSNDNACFQDVTMDLCEALLEAWGQHTEQGDAEARLLARFLYAVMHQVYLMGE